MRKAISLLLLMTISVCTAAGLSSCAVHGTVCGDFVYEVIEGTATAKISGLSDSGKKKEVLIVPETIDGFTVTEIGSGPHGYFSGVYPSFSSDKLRRFYLPYPVKIVSLPYYAKTFYLPCEYDESSEMGMAYCNPYRYELTDFSEKTITGRTYLLYADLVYFYNYDGAPEDGCYWIDDYDNERITYPPQDPEREGFRFTGWFKEAECFTPWDFERDILPQKYYPTSYYDKNSELRITHLYAGWERVN